jgi:sialate O-acetylesterase
MIPRKFFLVLALLVGGAANLFALDARPFLAPVFSDHMVMQRGKPNPVWGWTNPGATVSVLIVGGEAATAKAGNDGRWEVKLNPPATGGPYVIRISGPRELELRDVLVGDVWFLGGQSNMHFGITNADGGPAAVAAANHPTLRLFDVQQQVGYAPKHNLSGTWKTCTPETIAEGGNGGFSAVGYFFAQRLSQQIDVPIGLINDCVGGTPAETWTSLEGLAGVDGFAGQLKEVRRLRDTGAPEYGNYIMHWYDEYDQGIKGLNWSAPEFDDSAWRKTDLPTAFAALGLSEVPALVWLRKEVVVPDPLPPGTARIRLGVVEKMETTFVNGTWVGASSWVENPRNYAIPEGVLKPGKNLLTLRVLKIKSKAAFLSPAADLQLELGDGTRLPLANDWNAAVSVDARAPHPLPLGYENYPTMPTVLNNGMLQPVAPLALTGFLWYQGEANSDRAFQYRSLLPAMIADWRQSFGQGDLPFYIVSLPAFMARRATPGSDGWAELREAQALTAATVKNTGVAVTIDTGDANNIHPTEKKPVGERLALLALANHYGIAVESSGPTFDRMETSAGALRVHFAHAEGGLVNKGDKVGEFSVAGADGVWHWADAVIEGETVVVSSPEVPHPEQVRYAWQANPLASLFNKSGLPAAPFRTDKSETTRR